MKFFIDTANLEQIREAYDLGVLDGVTTKKKVSKEWRTSVSTMWTSVILCKAM